MKKKSIYIKRDVCFHFKEAQREMKRKGSFVAVNHHHDEFYDFSSSPTEHRMGQLMGHKDSL